MKKIILSILTILSSYNVYSQSISYGGVEWCWSICQGAYTTVDCKEKINHHEFYSRNIPSGWRLPTKAELLSLLSSAKALYIYTSDPNYARFEFDDDRSSIGLTLDLTFGVAFGGYRQTMGAKCSYLVKEGVISFSHSRPLREEIREDRIYPLLENNEQVRFGIEEYVKFEATFDKPASVRLVRDL